jgi:hypothetical protein
LLYLANHTSPAVTALPLSALSALPTLTAICL